jgi:hypothetical protein
LRLMYGCRRVRLPGRTEILTEDIRLLTYRRLQNMRRSPSSIPKIGGTPGAFRVDK